jgi:LPXTG-motif cell wall-anchored protein
LNMFVFSALGPATGNFNLILFISMFGEVFMVLCFLLYARRREYDCKITPCYVPV